MIKKNGKITIDKSGVIHIVGFEFKDVISIAHGRLDALHYLSELIMNEAARVVSEIKGCE